MKENSPVFLKTWFLCNDVMKVIEKPSVIGNPNIMVIGHRMNQTDSTLVIGQVMVVISLEGMVMHQGCYKSMATAQAAPRREMVQQSQLFLLFLNFSALCSAPAHGQALPTASAPGLSPTFCSPPSCFHLSLCPSVSPESPHNCTR